MKISEEWLKSVGFKWHQFDRHPRKQWVLWLGGCMECPPDGEGGRQGWRFSGPEDFGIELAAGNDFWFCWFRGDSAGRYHRFIHVRHMRYQAEVTALVAALTGREWKPENHFYGSAMCQRCADRTKSEQIRMDIVANASRAPWHEPEKDESRGRPLIEHVEVAIKNGGAK